VALCLPARSSRQVGLVVARGQHQDWRGLVLARAQLAAKHQTVVAGQHHVEHDQVDSIGFQELAHLAAIWRHGHAQAVFGQVGRDQFADFPVVVHDQDMVHMRFHLCHPWKNIF